MADSGIKKAIVLKENLPAVRSDNKYFVRYRMVSNSLFSNWSPIYTVDNIPTVTTSGIVQATNDLISVVWEDEFARPKYDIFVKFDNNDYFYHGSSLTHNYSFLRVFPGMTLQDPKPSSVKVIIQSESQDKQISNSLKIFESETYSLI